MSKLSNWWKLYQQNKNSRRERAFIEDANMLFDVSVHKNELWLVYRDCLVCPISMFADSYKPSAIVEQLRKLYVQERKSL